MSSRKRLRDTDRIEPGEESWQTRGFFASTPQATSKSGETIADRTVSIEGYPGENDVVGGRYRLLSSLGRGGFGVVYEAQDMRDDARVALKLVAGRSAHQRARVRREIAALRRLRIPGVVGLRDEGIEHAYAYLVMDLVEGSPFPGRNIPASWDQIEAQSLELLRVLSRIHAVGVVHRDLKPSNVLVHGESVCALDFGLSGEELLGSNRLTRDGEIVGTPEYLAPEQILGHSATARTDLYAVGLMLYEALTGRRPHDTGPLAGQLHARIHEPPAHVAAFAPNVPAAVAATIDALLTTDPRRRPEGALEVIARLRGERPIDAALLPRLARADLVEQIASTLADGRACDIVGTSGSGRSQLLAVTRQELERRGFSVILATGSGAPLAALGELGVLPETDPSTPLAEIEARAESAITALQDAGTILVIDDADELDGATARAVDAAAQRGPVVRVFREDMGRSPATARVEVGPLAAASLRDLFHGPDRLFHLRRDAARVLFQRTSGHASRVSDEIHEWLRMSLCRRDGARLTLDRDAIERLDSALALIEPKLPRPSKSLRPNLESLLGWITASGRNASVPLLRRATELPRWRVEADLTDLARIGAVRIQGERLEPLRIPFVIPSEEERARMHRRLADVLPFASPAALSHAIAASHGDAADCAHIAQRCLAVAERLSRIGMLAKATVVLAEGVASAETAGEAGLPTLERLLTMWVRVALSEVTTHRLDRVLYELCRHEDALPSVRHLERLVRAAIALEQWTERTAEEADEVEPFAEPALERLRHGVRVAAARRTTLAHEEQLLEELTVWAQRSSDSEDVAAWAGWLGRLRYRQGDFAEAARLQQEAARARWATPRALAQLNVASALLELHRHDEAEGWARRAHRLAARCRHPFLEARAAWAMRNAAYRSGRATSPDRELVDAALRLEAKPLDGMIALTEATIAWRSKQSSEARELADIARAVGRRGGEPILTLLGGAIAFAAGEPTEMAALERLLDRAAICAVPIIGLQALALLRMGGHDIPSPLRDELVFRSGANDTDRSPVRDVLSIEECLHILGDGQARDAAG